MKKPFSLPAVLILGIFIMATLSVLVIQPGSAEGRTCWCCIDGKVVQTSPEMCKEKRGRCFSTKEEALKNCQPPLCWCCINGRVSQVRPDRCKEAGGRCFSTKEEAIKYCQPNLCWCCVNGQVIQMNPESCEKRGGRCFRTKEEAMKYCQANTCWCCINGRVIQMSPEACKKREGRCYRTKEEAMKRCQAQDKLPDITSRKGIVIGGKVGGAGGKFVPFGGTVVLTKADSFLQSGGKCAFNISYNMVNTGPVPTAPTFKNRIRSDGSVVSIQSNLSLDAGQSKSIHTQAYLAPGKHRLTLSLDDDNVANESNEGNNKFSVRILLKGNCKNLRPRIQKHPREIKKPDLHGPGPQVKTPVIK